MFFNVGINCFSWNGGFRMKLMSKGQYSRTVTIIGLFGVLFSVVFIFGVYTNFFLFALLLLLQVVLVITFDYLKERGKETKRNLLLLSGMAILAGIVSFINAFYLEE